MTGRECTAARARRGGPRSVQPLKVEHATGARVRFDFLQGRQVRIGGGNRELAAAPMRDAPLGTVAVQKIAAGDAQPRFEGIGLVVDAGMNDFTIARTGMHAEVAFAFENDHFPATSRQRPGHGQANDPCADHNAIDVVQRNFSSRW